MSEQQQQSKNGCDTAELCERMYGIRVSAVEEEANDDQYKFDYEKETRSEEKIAEKFVAKMEADLLRLGPGIHWSVTMANVCLLEEFSSIFIENISSSKGNSICGIRFFSENYCRVQYSYNDFCFVC